jgi:hypothetical protein
MVMQRHYVLALAIVAAIGLLSAQQGPACPYQLAERAAAQSPDTSAVSEGTPGDGSLLSFGRTAIYAP